MNILITIQPSCYSASAAISVRPDILASVATSVAAIDVPTQLRLINLLNQPEGMLDPVERFQKRTLLGCVQARQEFVLLLSHQGYKLPVQGLPLSRQAQPDLSPLDIFFQPFDQASLYEARHPAADARLVRTRGRDDVLSTAWALRCQGGHDTPLNNIDTKALDVNPGEFLAEFSSQSVESERNKAK